MNKRVCVSVALWMWSVIVCMYVRLAAFMCAFVGVCAWIGPCVRGGCDASVIIGDIRSQHPG